MKWNKVPSGDLNGLEQRLRVGYGNYADLVTERSGRDEGFAQLVATQIVDAAVAPYVTAERAKAIMGNNFFGVEEACEHLQVRWSDQERDAMRVVPFMPETLAACADTHLLVAMPDWSVKDVIDQVRNRRLLPFPIALSNENPPSAGTVGGKNHLGWRLIYKGSEAKPSLRRHALTAGELIYACAAYTVTNGCRLLLPIGTVVRCYESTESYDILVDVRSDGLLIRKHLPMPTPYQVFALGRD